MIGVLLCLGGLSYWNTRVQSEKQLLAFYQDKAEEGLRATDHSVREVERELHFIAMNPVVQKTLQDQYGTYLEANNEVSTYVETRFWYLTTSETSGIQKLEILFFRDIPNVGNFIFGRERAEAHPWYPSFLQKQRRLLYAEGTSVYLVYPIFQDGTLEMIGAIWVELDQENLWEHRLEDPAILGREFGLEHTVLLKQGKPTGGIRIEATSKETGFRLQYVVKRSPLLEGGLVLLILVITGGIVLIILFFHYTDQMKTEYGKILEGRKKQEYLQLLVLKAQISPHFLYNIISMINWKAKYSGQEDISRICRELSDFYRTALNKGQEEITVTDELLNTESYLKLKQQLVEIPFAYQIDIDEGCGNLWIINFILQPIVENAIIHGIGNLEGGGRIRISVEQMEGNILIKVEDNGNQPVSQEQFFANKNGYGIKNVNERIQLKYGSGYGVFLSRSDFGTEVLLKIRGKQVLDW